MRIGARLLTLTVAAGVASGQGRRAVMPAGVVTPGKGASSPRHPAPGGRAMGKGAALVRCPSA